MLVLLVDSIFQIYDSPQWPKFESLEELLTHLGVVILPQTLLHVDDELNPFAHIQVLGNGDKVFDEDKFILPVVKQSIFENKPTTGCTYQFHFEYLELLLKKKILAGKSDLKWILGCITSGWLCVHKENGSIASIDLCSSRQWTDCLLDK